MTKKRTKKTDSAKEVKTTTRAKRKALVTLLQNGYVSGKLYKKGESVEVTPEHKARLVKKSHSIYK